MTDAPPWLVLLRDLAQTFPDSGVWKNSSKALAGIGDVDFVAPSSSWPEVRTRFERWASTHGMTPIPACLHRPGAMYLLAMPEDGDRLVQLDVRSRVTFHRMTVFTAAELSNLLVVDALGYRRTRHGAEGVLSLFLKCTSPAGSLLFDCMEESSVETLLRNDWEGALLAARLFRAAEPEVIRTAMSIISGSWDDATARAVVRKVRRAGLREPATTLRLMPFLITRRSCPLLSWVIDNGQAVPPDRDSWLTAVSKRHPRTALPASA